MLACSSPEKLGEEHAMDEISMWDKYIQEQIDSYNEFLESFDRSHYTTRTEAKMSLNERIVQVEANLGKRLEELNVKWSDMSGKYSDDSKKLSAMYDAYHSLIDSYQMDTTMVAELHLQANNKIRTIIPSAPDKVKINTDLIGRTVKSLPGGHLSDYWSWTIERGDVHGFEIYSTKDINSENKEYNVTYTLQKKGGAYKVVGTAYYTLTGRDDWELEAFLPSEIEVVKTGRYDNSISSEIGEYIVGTYIIIRNNSDATLIVGFTTIDSYGKSKRASRVIKGGETISYQELGLKDYTIDFVERP